ncbi:S-layer homology domain-containing protein [Candidatus Peregrinibacteria bacterium]|jgi:hypothetical protein|nr:S-layer homology domain-containing protein [Candidatus Peregrinibacteria bacterium]MBT7484648.1 S-layer homology domain-containing protein [Candidatus Peregrinibacteria bacterium]MBT7703393.1 S-layer homology domain-containing protein [Candidatus Peregrinibacteria bacterium]
MKRFLAIFGLVAMIFINTALANFEDVTEEHEHYAAIQWIEGRSIIQGYEDGTFQPDNEVNRAEALKLILLGSEIEVPELTGEEEILYSDVALDDWFAPYIYKATELEIIEGYEDGTFLPAQTVNLAETLKMIALARDIEPEAPESDPYEDVLTTDWFAPYVAYCQERNFIQAQIDGYLHPELEVNRGDLAEIIYRFMFTETYELDEFSLSTNWPELQSQIFDYKIKTPTNWQQIIGDDGTLILWNQDTENGQESWDRTTEGSAVITVRVDLNEELTDSTTYFAATQAGLIGYENLNIVTTTAENDEAYYSMVATYLGEYEGFRDVVIEMGDVFVTIQGTFGTGLLKDQLYEYVEAIEQSIVYSPVPVVEPVEPELIPEEIVAQARENIQVDGQGQAMLDLFEDLELIETDTIGVGTGPVDYYYSEWGNVTLKYERSFDVILDIEEGQTTAF